MLKNPKALLRERFALPAITLLVAFLLTGSGCSDNCGDVVCGPVPPALQVEVYDSVTVEVQKIVQRDDPPGFDTTIELQVKQLPVSDAMVTLHRLEGADTVAFDTLEVSGTTYTRSDLTGLPNTSFLVRGERGGRRVAQGNLSVKRIEGCCPYTIVGFVRLNLPVR